MLVSVMTYSGIVYLYMTLGVICVSVNFLSEVWRSKVLSKTEGLVQRVANCWCRRSFLNCETFQLSTFWKLSVIQVVKINGPWRKILKILSLDILLKGNILLYFFKVTKLHLKNSPVSSGSGIEKLVPTQEYF